MDGTPASGTEAAVPEVVETEFRVFTETKGDTDTSAAACCAAACWAAWAAAIAATTLLSMPGGAKSQALGFLLSGDRGSGDGVLIAASDLRLLGEYPPNPLVPPPNLR